jgi:Ribbon-helix-helix protein, copG family.
LSIATKKKMGRPTDNPKDTTFRVRLDKESIKKLNEAANTLQTTRSDVIRKGIDTVYDSLKK